MKNKYDFKDLMSFGMFLIALHGEQSSRYIHLFDDTLANKKPSLYFNRV